jgi:hypothetical protein
MSTASPTSEALNEQWSAVSIFDDGVCTFEPL